MKLKNFFLSCSSTSGGRSRKLEEKHAKYGGLRPVSPPPPPPPPLAKGAPIDPIVAAYLRQDYYTAPPKKHLTNSYSSYSCGSASSESSHSSTKSGSCASSSSGIGSYSSTNSNPNSMSKNKRILDSRSGRHRTKPKSICTNRQCTEYHNHKTRPAEFGLGTPSPDDLGE